MAVPSHRLGVRVRSTFQHGGAALTAPPLGGVLGGAAFSLVFCWAVLPGLLLCLLLRFSLFFSVVLPSFPSFGWGLPHDGLLECWAVGSGVG